MKLSRQRLSKTVNKRRKYYQHIKSLFGSNLIQYIPMQDTSGTVATDISGNNRNGNYTSVLLNNTAGPKGGNVPSLNNSGYLDVFSAGLNTAMSKTELTISIWIKVSAAADWTDGVDDRIIAYTQADGSNIIQIAKATDNMLGIAYIAGGVNKSIYFNCSFTGWTHLGIVVSKNGDYLRAYMNGTKQGSDMTGLGTWSGSLDRFFYGVNWSGGSKWKGWMADGIILNRAATDTEMAKIYSISSGWSVETPFQKPANPVWEDNFDGVTLDTTKWTTVDNGWDPANNSWMTPANVSVSGGSLHLASKIESMPNSRPYSSAGVYTSGKFSFQYGRIEVKAQLPTTKGMWPAIWMLPPDPNMFIIGTPGGFYGTWPLSGEIDLIETLGTAPLNAQVNVHYGNPHTANSTGYIMSSDCTNWHVYALEWQAHVMRWYIDDVLVKQDSYWFTSEGTAYPAPFDKPMSIIINVVVGGTWQGDPDGTTSLPNQMLIDWVKVYQ